MDLNESSAELMGGKKVCVLLSGGLDSCVLAWMAQRYAHEVLPVYTRTGLVWEQAEMYWLGRILKNLSTPRLLPLKVFDLLGREVMRLAQGDFPAGYHTFHWNAHGQSGRPVSSGVYFARVQVKDVSGRIAFTKINKLLLLH